VSCTPAAHHTRLRTPDYDMPAPIEAKFNKGKARFTFK
jgi:hypothetical protein